MTPKEKERTYLEDSLGFENAQGKGTMKQWQPLPSKEVIAKSKAGTIESINVELSAKPRGKGS